VTDSVTPVPTGDSVDDPTAGAELETGHALERLIYFSDAVFAIALTLLALALPVPQGDTNRALWHSFTSHLGSDYLTFLISFLVIARFWTIHHRFFGRVRGVDRWLIQLDLLYLLWIVVLPFATRVLGDVGEYAFGTAVYAISVALVGLSFAALAGYGIRAGLVGPQPGHERPSSAVVGSLVAAAVFLASVPLALVSPDGAKFFWLVLIPLSPVEAAWTARRRPRRAGPRE
jgi:uncharacterized membrane protein